MDVIEVVECDANQRIWTEQGTGRGRRYIELPEMHAVGSRRVRNLRRVVDNTACTVLTADRDDLASNLGPSRNTQALNPQLDPTHPTLASQSGLFGVPKRQAVERQELKSREHSD